MKVKHLRGKHYYNSEKKYFITTNYKVMFSNLAKQPTLQPAKRSSLVKNRILQYFKLGKPHYLLVRPTEKRIVSFYKNKFIRGMKDPKIASFEDFQPSLRIFFPYLDINKETSLDEIKQKVSNTSFNTMVEILPNVYHLDGHISPQIWCQEFTYKTQNIKLKFTQIYNIEKPEDLELLQTHLGLDVAKKTNSSDTTNVTINWDEKTKNIIEKLYKEDQKLIQDGK